MVSFIWWHGFQLRGGGGSLSCGGSHWMVCCFAIFRRLRGGVRMSVRCHLWSISVCFESCLVGIDSDFGDRKKLERWCGEIRSVLRCAWFFVHWMWVVGFGGLEVH